MRADMHGPCTCRACDTSGKSGAYTSCCLKYAMCPSALMIHTASCSGCRRHALVSAKGLGIWLGILQKYHRTLAAISEVLRDSTGGRPSALALKTPSCCSSPSATTTQFSAHPAVLCWRHPCEVLRQGASPDCTALGQSSSRVLINLARVHTSKERVLQRPDLCCETAACGPPEVMTTS